jgi:hypothetical protein
MWLSQFLPANMGSFASQSPEYFDFFESNESEITGPQEAAITGWWRGQSAHPLIPIGSLLKIQIMALSKLGPQGAWRAASCL